MSANVYAVAEPATTPPFPVPSTLYFSFSVYRFTSGRPVGPERPQAAEPATDGMDSSPQRHQRAKTTERPRRPKQEGGVQVQTTQAGIDIAKAVFEVALSDTPGTVRERHRLSRERFRRFFSRRDATMVLMEACGAAHYWGRELEAMGHQVRLLHPGDVARYRDGNKTDRADAKAVLEASRNTALDPVPVKSREQQAIAALHRLRQGYLQTRTARINAVRGHLREFGIVIPVRRLRR